MSLPKDRWTLLDAPRAARTYAQKRCWAKITNLSLRMHGIERDALAVGDVALRDEYWNGDDFLSTAFNLWYASHTKAANNDPVEADDGLDDVQRVIAADSRVREILSSAFDSYQPEPKPEPVLAIETEKSSLDFNPVELRLVERHDTAAERGLKLYEDHVEHLSEMQRLYQDYDFEVASKYLEGK